MNSKTITSEFNVDLETRNVSHADGWVFRVVPAMNGRDTWEVVCVAHPTPVTPKMADAAVTLASAAQQAYVRALAVRH
jgi:hypothetical protein